jgi:hypothetical protein
VRAVTADQHGENLLQAVRASPTRAVPGLEGLGGPPNSAGGRACGIVAHGLRGVELAPVPILSLEPVGLPDWLLLEPEDEPELPELVLPRWPLLPRWWDPVEREPDVSLPDPDVPVPEPLVSVDPPVRVPVEPLPVEPVLVELLPVFVPLPVSVAEPACDGPLPAPMPVPVPAPP